MVSRELLDEGALAASSVVANCAMNRERQLAGVNSYTRELGFNPLEWLHSRTGNDSTDAPAEVAWLDLCCGTGRERPGFERWHARRAALESYTLAGLNPV